MSQKFDFDYACREFVFCNTNNELLYFFTATELFEYNYVSMAKKNKHTFPQALRSPPRFGKFDEKQERLVVTAQNDLMYVDMKNNVHLDLDRREGLQDIEDIFYHEDKFYILSNRKDMKLGFYLLCFDANNPDEYCDLLVAWNHMLDIGDADL